MQKVDTNQNIKAMVKRFSAVCITDDIYSVFETFSKNICQSFIPVVNEKNAPIGIILESELKEFAYARYGHELIRRYSIRSFIKYAPVIAIETPIEEVLSIASKEIKCSSGIIVSQNNEYLGVLLLEDLLQLFQQRHNENKMRIMQLEKFEAIATLAGGIAHDLNNILVPIIGYAELLDMSIKSGEAIEPDMIQEIYRASLRAKKVVSNMLTASRHKISEAKPVSLTEIIKDVIRFIRSSIPATIDIEMNLQHCCDTIFADPYEIKRALLNICTNAYQAIQNRTGSITISLENIKNVKEYTIVGWSPKGVTTLDANKEWIVAKISDTGSGIPKMILPKIFDPFFTTKAHKEGTGLGLSITLGILDKIGAFISVESIEGKGTTFYLYFPIADKDACKGIIRDNTISLSQNPLDNQNDHNTEICVLFIDDEFSITRVAQRMLAKYKIKTECINDPLTVLSSLKDGTLKVDAVITDQMMPGITGIELTEQIRNLKYDIPIILCTGYAESVSYQEAIEKGIVDYFVKPIDFHQLARAIIRVVKEKEAQKRETIANHMP